MIRFFERLIDPFPPQQPEKPPSSLFGFCRYYVRGYERLLVLLAFLTATVAASEALLYGVLGQIVDWLASREPQSFLHDNWPTLLAMSLFVLLVLPLAASLHAMVLHQTFMSNFPMLVRWKAHRYLLNQSYSFFQNEFSGRVATKVMQTALAVRETVIKLLDVMLFVQIYLITTLILIASADWRLCLPLAVWLVFYIAVLRIFVPRFRKVSLLQADARSLMTGRVVDSYTNILTLKLFSHASRESEYVKQAMSEFLATAYPQMRLGTWLNVSLWALNMLMVFAVASTGLYLWMEAAITPGAIAIALSLAIRLTGMSHWIMWEITSLFENIGTVQDGINTLAVPHAIQDSDTAGELQVSAGQLDFDQVDFSYHQQEPVFQQLQMGIAAGEKVGIVGRSGAGKSTLVNLLLRFYDVDSGAVRIDGTDIRDVRQESLRANIAMVTQDTSLLHRSVRDNIMFGRPDASEAEMIAAAKKAEAHDFILGLRDHSGRSGYDAHVGERGVNLSGGQRQRIAIARVLLKDAPILVLDEATSALDSEVEASIQSSLYALMEGKTVIAIAHRLSTIAAMDRLIVFDSGRIVEQGSHAELLQQGGLYAQLWAHQSGGFLGSE